MMISLNPHAHSNKRSIISRGELHCSEGRPDEEYNLECEVTTKLLNGGLTASDGMAFEPLRQVYLLGTMTSTHGKIRIGTSNGYIRGNKSTFPPEFRLKSRLHYYSQFFNTIEVNRCFYKTPLRSTYEKWVADVPDDFQFSLKLSKAVTHEKGLSADISCMENFLQTASGTGDKKGCLLIQFPGKITIEHFTQVERLFDQLRVNDPAGDWRKAIEFRNESWYIGETTELLDEFDATMVIHDFSKAKVTQSGCKANFVYMRFHGPAGNYRDSYPAKFLEEKAIQIKLITASGKDVYAYFNNTIGSAFENARLLQSKLG